MDFITNAVTLAVTGTVIAVTSFFGATPNVSTPTPEPTAVKVITVCGSAGLLPADVTPAKC